MIWIILALLPFAVVGVCALAIVSAGDYQRAVREWTRACFGEFVSGDREERNWRFLEESLELVQSLGCSRDDALRLLEYVYDRPVGEPYQETGGVMVTLAALCNANQMDMRRAGWAELARCWMKIDRIREKQKMKEMRNVGKGL